ncbi:MAG: hypothetical protein U9Q39_06805 [Pseudomonadota bacterium]|nr:hypothetical protein [Pseudomonadota bacterium]
MTGNLIDQAVAASQAAHEQRLRYLTELSKQRTLNRPEARELDQLTARLSSIPGTPSLSHGDKRGVPGIELAAPGDKSLAANAEKGQKLRLDSETPPERRFCKTVNEASEILGVSRRTLYNYRDEGMPWKEKGAKFFDLTAIWNWLWQRENGEAVPAATGAGVGVSENENRDAEKLPAALPNPAENSENKSRSKRIADRAELEKEKLRRQNRKLELETKRLEKELVSRSLVEEQQIERVATVKKGLFLLVDQLPPLLVNCNGDEAKTRELLKEGVTRLLAAFSRPIEMG